MSLDKILYGTDKFVELESTISSVQEEISFWGHRYVYIPGGQEKFPIDILAKRILELMEKFNFEYSDDERAAGKKIAAKIDQLYDENDKRLEGKWCITQWLCWFVDSAWHFTNKGYPPSFHWHRTKFDRYTAKQYEEKFHCQVEQSQLETSMETDKGRICLYAPPK